MYNKNTAQYKIEPQPFFIIADFCIEKHYTAEQRFIQWFTFNLSLVHQCDENPSVERNLSIMSNDLSGWS